MADSYHASVHTMLEESREAGESTAFDRMDDMGTRCLLYTSPSPRDS